MPYHPDRRLPIEGAFNLRDLGGYALQGGAETRWGQALRADGLGRLTHGDIDLLLARGLRRVIDLRAPAEARQHPGKLSGISGIEVINLPLYNDLAPMREITDPEPLPGFYRNIIAARGEMVAEVFQAIAETGEGAVMFHCTAGKDRTGLIAALWLALAGAEREVILADYALTGELIPGLITLFNADLAARGIDPELIRPMLGCEPHYMEEALEFITTTYGDIPAYLREIGLSSDVLTTLRGRLVSA
ncbi:tyrosine-protein phosphatase [Falsigemmobacter faecalis]|uniref:Tyrosine-protein phosphatase n=1 Tax=Falsigemmobacter faecalis TaxID=2488730 RepID=A0A3P3DJG0_9RHOB|nr:tyrosine-protein phosphatase [Falsigemmobacter faecalis]RRH74305.1 tyrosine-protein phosphatase [Falsigemmobacter faecalis]